MDLTSRLRSIVRDSHAGRPASPLPHSGRPGSSAFAEASADRRSLGGGRSDPGTRRELVYEPDNGGYQATLDLDRMGAMLGGRPVSTPFGPCLVIDRRYESDRHHGDIRIEHCELPDGDGLRLLDPELDVVPANPARSRTIFLDLETTGLSGGAGTIAFLVGCGYFDLGAFQVRQFLLASHSAERALLAAVAAFFEDAELIVTYNGKTFDMPVMETRWLFHRMQPPLGGVPHFDMLHPARRLWRSRGVSAGSSAGRDSPGRRSLGEGGSPALTAPLDVDSDSSCCRLSTLERLLFGVRRVGDVPAMEIAGRFFTFVRTGDPRPLEPVLEHNRLDLVSLAAVTARASRLAQNGHDECRDGAEALALGRVYERAGCADRAEACYRHAAASESTDVRAEAMFRLGLRYRRDRRFEEAADVWRDVLAWTERPRGRRHLVELRRFAAEALAIHLEHRRRDLAAARAHALFALEETDARTIDGVRHRIARIDRKMAKKKSPGCDDPGLLWRRN